MTLETRYNKVEFRIEIRDRSFNVLEILDSQVAEVVFDYGRVGGCGEFSFRLPRKYCDEKYISGGFNIRIYIWNEATAVFDLWYQGRVGEKIPAIEGQNEYIDVVGHGYQSQLAQIQFQDSYTSMEASAIVKDILDNYIVGVKDITYSAPDIENTGYVIDQIDFNTDVQSALQTIADIVGAREWGVDMNRKLFFKARSTTPGLYFTLGGRVRNFVENQDFEAIVNHVFIQGGDVAGTPYQIEYDDLPSQAKYGRQDKVIQNSSITTEAVASQLAQSTFNDYNDVIRKANCEIVGVKQRIEASLPIPLFVLIADSAIPYGVQTYGTFLYSGLINRQVNRIQYTIDRNKSFKTSLDLGFLLPDDADYISRLQYSVEQLRTANL